ncbi:hypothetical protein TeGR_g7885 [Tetraparma gracilis]|uniref:PET hydrolase/cutinase-like domain-containing protein n=1 Tax=Tetraparma gracilis TaxID=2962635 RepID=A0ABQ6MIH9_9STRA|nr:hypothetical protein TeGR_g7885 [Tetraparma gracilis]
MVPPISLCFFLLLLCFLLPFISANSSLDDVFSNFPDALPDAPTLSNVGSLSPGFRPHPAGEPLPLPGLYKTSWKKFRVDEMDPTNKHITVFFPTNYDASAPPFRFLAYAHGFGGGGLQTGPVYYEICSALASWGYVVTLHHSCDVGCTREDGKFGFDDYYKEQLKAIDWAEGMWEAGDAAFANLDFESGVGVVGHSMGGQATLFSSAYNATSHNIKAAVYHHAWTEDFPAPQVPFLSMTSTYDDEADATTMGQAIYDIEGTEHHTKGLVSKANFGHHEADILGINPLLGQFTAAWFKLMLEGKGEESNVDYEEMIFGTSSTSICGGGDGAVDDNMCELVDNRH